MEFGKEKIDDAIFALLFLTLDRDGRAWKGFDCDSMNRLPAKVTSTIQWAMPNRSY